VLAAACAVGMEERSLRCERSSPKPRQSDGGGRSK
jgi:hypothetical protein